MKLLRIETNEYGTEGKIIPSELMIYMKYEVSRDGFSFNRCKNLNFVSMYLEVY